MDFSDSLMGQRMSEFDDKVSSNLVIIDTLRFEAHSSKVFNLGADLVTDDMNPPIEPIKKHYDADASRANINIDTQTLKNTGTDTGYIISEAYSSLEKERKSKKIRNIITIVNYDMEINLDKTHRSWLIASISHKKLMQPQKNTTTKERTPLGDKNLRYFGAQHLGDFTTLVTHKRENIFQSVLNN